MDVIERLAFGKDNIDTRHRSNGVFCRCVDCNEVISNPVCPECLSLQMKVMVAEKNPELAEEIDAPQIEGESTCLHCNKSMGLCAHCFCRDVYYQLIGKDKEIAQEFLSRFDYELRVNLI